MKKLSFAALIAAGTSQAAGCVVAEDPRITADIQLLNPGPGAITCLNDRNDPRGMDGIRLNARLTGTQSGESFVENCNVAVFRTPPLLAGVGDYDFWVDYINDRGFPNDPSQWVVVDSTNVATVFVDTDVSVVADLNLRFGFFDSSWLIENAVGSPVTCGPGFGVSMIATLSGTSTADDYVFDCAEGFDTGFTLTDPLAVDDYVISADLLDDQDNVITTQASTANASIVNGNDYTELDITLVVP